MHRISILAAFVLFFCVAGSNVQAQEIAVEEIQICTSVEDREPLGTDTSFDSNVERLYCFTKLVGADEGTTIMHVWYHEDEEKATTELNVGGSPWRTWSSKAIWEGWVGKWRVEVVANGNVLKTVEFTVQ